MSDPDPPFLDSSIARRPDREHLIEPVLAEAGLGYRGAMVWKWARPMAVLSSAPVGGGWRKGEWVLNIGVAPGYARTDLADHAQEVASRIGLRGSGVTMFTAANLRHRRSYVFEGVRTDGTVGVRHPTWAAGSLFTDSPARPGTINLVLQMPVALEHAAAVNAVITATEAKTQALADREVPGTGTATDAIAVVWPTDGSPERFAGPRSRWGSRIAEAVYRTVWAGVGIGLERQADIARQRRRGTSQNVYPNE